MRTLVAGASIFHSMSIVDLPEMYENSKDAWFSMQLALLGFHNDGLMGPDERTEGPLQKLKGQICENMSLWSLRYSEEFSDYIGYNYFSFIGHFSPGFFEETRGTMGFRVFFFLCQVSWNDCDTTQRWDCIILSFFFFLFRQVGESSHFWYNLRRRTRPFNFWSKKNESFTHSSFKRGSDHANVAEFFFEGFCNLTVSIVSGEKKKFIQRRLDRFNGASCLFQKKN